MCNISFQRWKLNAINEVKNGKCQKLNNGIEKARLKYNIVTVFNSISIH